MGGPVYDLKKSRPNNSLTPSDSTYNDIVLPKIPFGAEIPVNPLRTRQNEDGPSLTTRKAQESSQGIFKIFRENDTNNDGLLSKKELAQAIQNPNYTGLEAQAAAGVYSQFDRIKALRHDGQLDGVGISLNDLSELNYKLELLENQNLQKQLAGKYLTENFKKIDVNGDNHLTSAELNKFGENITRCDEQLSYRAARDQFIDLVKTSGQQSFSSTTLSNYAGLPQIEQSIASNFKHIANRTAESQRENICMELYAHPENPVLDININAIHQGSTGNCYFLASLVSVVRTNPELIVKMITDNENGTYSVKFPCNQHSITVQGPTEAEMGLFNQGNSSGTWACVLEKAYGQHRRNTDRVPIGETPTEGAGGGGFPAHAIETLTGFRSITQDFFNTPSSQVKLMLHAAVEQNQPIVVSFDGKYSQNEKTFLGYTKNHAYSVVAFDPQGPSGGTVFLKNPWGTSVEGGRDGITAISLQQFKENFTSITHGSNVPLVDN